MTDQTWLTASAKGRDSECKIKREWVSNKMQQEKRWQGGVVNINRKSNIEIKLKYK